MYPPRMSSERVIYVNGFYFCGHGLEVCNLCRVEARVANDESLRTDTPIGNSARKTIEEMMDVLDGITQGMARIEKTPRQSLSVMASALDTRRLAFEDDGGTNYTIWACKLHKDDNCRDCFDWRALIKTERKNAENQKQERRTGVLALLGVLGVHLSESASAELSSDVLEKKLCSALSLCQSLSESALGWLNMELLRAWNVKASLADAFQPRTATTRESASRRPRSKVSRATASLPVENTSNTLNEIVMRIARVYDNGHRLCVIQDVKRETDIRIRILSAHKYKEVPIIFLSFSIKDGQSSFAAERDIGMGDLMGVEMTIEEQTLLLRLLQLNSERLTGDLRSKMNVREHGYSASFLVPITSLSLDQVVELAGIPGCGMCGRLCALCQSASYCGQEAQRSNWEEHLLSCKGVLEGTWTDVTFIHKPIVHGQLGYASIFNLSSGKLATVDGSCASPSHVHGDKTFLAKIQRPAWITGPVDTLNMLVYDRSRTLHGLISARGNPEFWTAILCQMPFASAESKVYRYVKRTGDRTLSVCMDRQPSPDITQW
ncbi:unnamed protein product [Peniophora sp. CBMAI 1063]|nr:unnamed protein product [Peniophora sp. CBMAI 1063]